MTCPKCNSELQHDEESKTYYCDSCNHLYSEDEIEKPMVPLFRLTPFMSIPIINVFLMKCASSDDERKVYSNIVISSLFVSLVYCSIFAAILYSVKSTTIDGFRVETRQYFESIVKEFDPRGLKPRVYEFEGAEVGDKPTKEEQVYELNDEVVRLLTNSAVTGATLKHIVNQYPAYSYLVQTLSCAQKYQDMSYYFCVGHVVREANKNGVTSTMTSYTGDLEGTFTQLAEVVDPSVLEEERTIMYIYESQRFNVTPIHNRQGNVIGLAFVELEV